MGGIGVEGFVVLPGPFRAELANAIGAARAAIAGAPSGDVREGSTTLRVNGMLERAPLLSVLLDYPPLLEAARNVCGGSFRLSSFHARGVRPGAFAQKLHQDVPVGAEGWPLTGFIWMVDAFNTANGATRFVPGSASVESLPNSQLIHHPGELQACGAAGSLVVYNGSVWHGHGRNRTAEWRWSVQGAFIPAK